jgi:hypothetical protein
MLFLDGFYVEDGHGKLRFYRIRAPNVEELKALVHAISCCNATPTTAWMQEIEHQK